MRDGVEAEEADDEIFLSERRGRDQIFFCLLRISFIFGEEGEGPKESKSKKKEKKKGETDAVEKGYFGEKIS